MKYLSTLLLISLFSCQQNHFDLADLKLPVAQDSILKKYKNTKEMELNDFIIYRSGDEKLLWFKNKSFAGTMFKDDDGKPVFNNYVEFYVMKQSGVIGAYKIHTETKAQSKIMIGIMEENFGKTDYHYQDKDFSSQIWEKDGLLYFFETNNTIANLGEQTQISNLTVTGHQSPEFLSWFTSGGVFNYYGDYLNEKSKNEHQGQQYSYKDFVQQKTAEAKNWGQQTTYYEKDYVK